MLPDKIIEKLTELGWDDEIRELMEYKPSKFTRHSIVNQPKDLTECSEYECIL